MVQRAKRMERALVHYDLLAINRVLPTVPKIRLSCIFCTWFPLRRSEDTPVEHPLYHLPAMSRYFHGELQGGLKEPGSTGQGGALYSTCLCVPHADSLSQSSQRARRKTNCFNKRLTLRALRLRERYYLSLKGKGG